jgi:hypothetical protein
MSEFMRVTTWQYLEANDDVRMAGADPLRHALDRVVDQGEPRCLKYPAILDTDAGKAEYWKVWPDVAFWKIDPVKHYIRHGWKEGRWPYPGVVIPPSPIPGGEIRKFESIPALDDVDNCYFTGCRVNGGMQFSTYKDNSYTSYLKDITGKELARFNAESGFMIILFKGRYYMSQEHGDYAKTDRGRVLQLQLDGTWKPVYTHPRWHLITEMHVHGDYLYATGCRWDDDADPAGIIRTLDGITWELYLESKYEYRFWGMTSEGSNLVTASTSSGDYLYATGCRWDDDADPAGIIRTLDGITWELYLESKYEYRFWGMTSEGSNLVTASTSSGADWGKNNCRPTVWRNKDMIWTDYDHPNSGFWAAEYWPKVKDTFLGRCGNGAVVRLSDRKEVLVVPGCDAIHDLLIDKKTDILMAFCNRPGNSGCIVKGTKDGNSWYTIDEGFTVPSIIDGYYDDETGDVYLMAGLFTGRGKVYRSVRG